jgi:hypothetical protein
MRASSFFDPNAKRMFDLIRSLQIRNLRENQGILRARSRCTPRPEPVSEERNFKNLIFSPLLPILT